MMITGKDSVGKKLGCLWKIGTWQLRSCSKGRRYSRRERKKKRKKKERRKRRWSTSITGRPGHMNKWDVLRAQ